MTQQNFLPPNQVNQKHQAAQMPVTLLYDGTCHLCSREIAHYRHLNTAHRLVFVDISAPAFDAKSWGVDATAINRQLHVRLADGTYRSGLDAFVTVWSLLPRYVWLARLAQTPGISTAMRQGYRVFAKIRPLLPKRAHASAECPLLGESRDKQNMQFKAMMICALLGAGLSSACSAGGPSGAANAPYNQAVGSPTTDANPLGATTSNPNNNCATATPTSASSTASNRSPTPTSSPNIAELMPLSSGNTHSSSTPLGIHYEYATTIVPSPSDSELLQNATRQPPIVPSTSGQSWQTFTVTLYPYGSPSPADVNQHAIGDCDGDSALSGLAYQHPLFIKTIIRDRGDNTFGVSMYDPMGAPITVSVDSQFMADSSGDIGQVSGKNGVADWASVLEKATMKYVTVYGTPGGSNNGLNTDIGGIGSEFLLPMFTGSGDSFAFGADTLTPDQFARAVLVSLQIGSFITGGFSQEGYPIGQDGTIIAHAYSVMRPNSTAFMATMRNPWGVNPWAPTLPNSGYDTSDDGLLSIPANTTWVHMIDLRIMAPGAAGDSENNVPYTPPAGTLFPSANFRVNISEPHAVR